MIFIEILAVIVLTCINGVLAMSELAMVSSRRSRLEHLAVNGSRGAQTALELLDEPSRFLSTVQIGITLVGVLTGAFGGATFGQRLGVWLDTFPPIAPYGASLGIGLTVLTITYISLVIGELVPKRIALSQPERIASLVAGPMRWLSFVTAPAVWILQVSSLGMLRILGLTNTRESTVTEEEVKSLIAEGTQAGVFAPQEHEMIEGVLRLADRSVRLIMTPRTKIVWLDIHADSALIIEKARSNIFSRLIVCDGSVDHPVGFVNTRQLLSEALTSENIVLERLITPLLFIPESATLLKLLNRFKKEQVHLAVIVDEYGAIEGLATLTDVIEAIAGDLPELSEMWTPDITQRNDGSWLADGTMLTDEVARLTGIDLGRNVVMLAGFMLSHLKKIPTEGASFAFSGARFEVVDMDGNRIDKVLIQLESGPDSGRVMDGMD